MILRFYWSVTGSPITEAWSFLGLYDFAQVQRLKSVTTPVGLEPTASGLEVRRAIHCATGSAAKKRLE